MAIAYIPPSSGGGINKNQVEGIIKEIIDLSDYAKLSNIPTKISQLANDSKFITASEVDLKILNAQLPEGEIDLSSLLDFTLYPSDYTENLVDRSTITTGYWSTSTSAVNGVAQNSGYSHTEPIPVSDYKRIAFGYKDTSGTWKTHTWAYWIGEDGVTFVGKKIDAIGEYSEEAQREIILEVPEGAKYIGINLKFAVANVDPRFYVKGIIDRTEKYVDTNKIYPPVAESTGCMETPVFDNWSRNLLDYSLLENGYINASNQISGIGSYIHTHHIDISKYTKVQLCNHTKSEQFHLSVTWGYFFTEDKTILQKLEPHGEFGQPIEFNVPYGAKYIVVNIYSSREQVGFDMSVKGYIGGQGEDNFVKLDRIYPPVDETVRFYVGDRYQGLKWVSFGDSITAQNKWQPRVIEKLGLVHTNCGIGSTCLSGTLDNSFAIPKPDEAMWQDVRLNAVMDADPDLVTIMGGNNDQYAYIPMGDKSEFDKPLAEKDKNSYYGAYSYIIETLLTWKPTLRIILITPSYAMQNELKGDTRLSDYAESCREIAKSYGLPCADIFGKAGINKLTESTYTSDRVHPNEAGALRIADVVIGTMLEV